MRRLSKWSFAECTPIDATDFERLREELQKMSLNDASFSFAPDTSEALGLVFVADSWECCTWKSSSSDSKKKPMST